MHGWSIIGSANSHLDRQGNESFVHRITVKEMPVATNVLKVLESDFNERNYEDRYVSQDDIRFIQLLNYNIKQKRDGHFEIPLPFKGSGPPVLPKKYEAGYCLAATPKEQDKGKQTVFRPLHSLQ